MTNNFFQNFSYGLKGFKKTLGVVLFHVSLLGLFTTASWAQNEDKTKKAATDTVKDVEESVTKDVESTSTEAIPAVQKVASPKPKASSNRIEKIKVTGSHIKRTDVEGPSPVMTLDRDYLDKSGYNSVGDILRDLPTATSGGERESSLNGGAATGAQFTSMRGFGSNSILILLDGRRLPAVGGGSSVDLNLIPAGAIERVEILMDGASALYGSDALGGVMNFITKKDYDGIQVQAGTTVPFEKGGMRYDASATYGKSGAKYNFLGVYQYRGTRPLWSRDRDFSRVDGEIAAMSPFGSPGTFRDVSGGGTSAQVEGPWQTNSSIPNGTQCPADQLRPDGNVQWRTKLSFARWNLGFTNLGKHRGLLPAGG